MKKWTQREDDMIIAYSRTYSNNLRFGFDQLSSVIGRSTHAIVTRFYNKLNKQSINNSLSAKEKAELLILEFFSVHTILHCKNGCITIDSIGMDSAKRCALIAVDEIISNRQRITHDKLYWREVKKQIELYTL